MKCTRIISMILAFSFLFSISITSFADDNANTGGGTTKPAVVGKYRSSEWMYKVSVYVGLDSRADTKTPIGGYKLIGQPVYVRPNFPMPSNVLYTKNNKVQYLNGAGIQTTYNPITIVDNDVPRIPVTHQGNLNNVKSYFGDTNTLEKILDRIAMEYGTTKEGLVSGINFNIANQNGQFLPEDILPSKNPETGRYQNLVPWVIVYEPVAIAHLRDGQTRIAFTATEYAIAQKQGYFDFFYSSPQAQWIANMTHANLPNSIVLEEDWFGFKAYKPLGNNVKWSDDRIIAGGGWGMRILRPGAKFEPEDIPEEPDPPGEDITLRNIDIGDYRTDTDVVTSFWVESDYEINPDSPGYVDFYIDGVWKHRQEFVLPEGGSQVVWVKWHTPKEPKTVTVEAVASKGRVQSSSTQKLRVVDLDAYEPPDPRARDPKTGKVIEKPSWFEMVNHPNIPNETYNEWSVWSAWWQENWIWISTGEDSGYWYDDGWWVFYQNHYSASISMNNHDMTFKPDEKVPTATRYYNEWTMKSGYGWNLDTRIRLNTNGSNAVAKQGNNITYLPEYKYKGYLRLSERVRDLEFTLKKNRFSTFEQRVHFTPLWYPNDKYTMYTRVIDVWTPAGHLYINKNEYMNIKGSVLDDYKAVPSKVDRWWNQNL